jgi:hypothetical protein
MTKELQCMIDDLPDDVFDLNFIQERYGEGSNICKPDP